MSPISTYKAPITVKPHKIIVPSTTAYITRYENCSINMGKKKEIENIAQSIINNRGRYELISGLVRYSDSMYRKLPPPPYTIPMTGIIPWYFIGCIHYMETLPHFSFNQHIYNGDPLARQTIKSPPNKPDSVYLGKSKGFTFEESAVCALIDQECHRIHSWNLPKVLKKLEGWNGFGYTQYDKETPYLWSYTNEYTAGKYISDKNFDFNAVSKQSGAVPILKTIEKFSKFTIPR